MTFSKISMDGSLMSIDFAGLIINYFSFFTDLHLQ